MANRAIIVITHGEFGIELIKSAEMIMGPQEDVKGLGLRPGESVDDLRAEAGETVEKFKEDGKEIIVCCDVLGGSPSNVALVLDANYHLQFDTGVNMRGLIELFQGDQDDEDTEELLNRAEATGSEGVKRLAKDFLKK
mgnify:FL=1